MTSNKFLRLINTAEPGESQARAGGESVSGDSEKESESQGSGGPSQAFELGRKNDSGGGGPSQGFELERKNDSEKKVTWLQKLMRRFGKRQRA